MEPRGKLTFVIGTREGEGSGLVTCRDTCSTLSVILGDIPVPGSVLLCRPVPQREKSSGSRSLLKTPVAVRLYVRSTSDLAHTPDLLSVQLLLDMSPASPASEGKDCRVAPDTSPVHLVSPSSLRQGPKSSTGSARMPLSQVTAFNTGSLTVIGSLDRGLVPKLRSC